MFTPAVRHGNLLYVSGHAAREGDVWVQGTLGADMGLDDGRRAAQLATLGCLATIKAEIGQLSRIRRFVKVLGMVRATPEFTQHPRVMDGCTGLLLEVFGPAGGHARSSVGMSSLPAGTAIEIEMIVALKAARRPAASSGRRGR